jgi:DNA-binding protein H-NS
MNIQGLEDARQQLLARHAAELTEFDQAANTVKRLLTAPLPLLTDSQALGRELKPAPKGAKRGPKPKGKPKTQPIVNGRGRQPSDAGQALLDIVRDIAQPFSKPTVREALEKHKAVRQLKAEQVAKLIENTFARWSLKLWIAVCDETFPKTYNRTKLFGGGGTAPTPGKVNSAAETHRQIREELDRAKTEQN